MDVYWFGCCQHFIFSYIVFIFHYISFYFSLYILFISLSNELQVDVYWFGSCQHFIFLNIVFIFLYLSFYFSLYFLYISLSSELQVDVYWFGCCQHGLGATEQPRHEDGGSLVVHQCNIYFCIVYLCISRFVFLKLPSLLSMLELFLNFTRFICSPILNYFCPGTFFTKTSISVFAYIVIHECYNCCCISQDVIFHQFYTTSHKEAIYKASLGSPPMLTTKDQNHSVLDGINVKYLGWEGDNSNQYSTTSTFARCMYVKCEIQLYKKLKRLINVCDRFSYDGVVAHFLEAPSDPRD